MVAQVRAGWRDRTHSSASLMLEQDNYFLQHYLKMQMLLHTDPAWRLWILAVWLRVSQSRPRDRVINQKRLHGPQNPRMLQEALGIELYLLKMENVEFLHQLRTRTSLQPTKLLKEVVLVVNSNPWGKKQEGGLRRLRRDGRTGQGVFPKSTKKNKSGNRVKWVLKCILMTFHTWQTLMTQHLLYLIDFTPKAAAHDKHHH